MPEAFLPWNRGGGRVLPGLVRRRKAEADLFRDGNHQKVHEEFHADKGDDDTPMPQKVDVADGSVRPMSTSKIGNAQVAIGAGAAIETASKVNDAINQANSIKQGAHDLGFADVLTNLVTMPTFWIAVAIIVAAGAAWYWRSQHAQAGV